MDRGARHVHPAVASERGGRVRTVASGVHPDGPAHRTGDPDRPLQTVQSGRGRATGEHRKAQGGTGHHLGPLDGERLERRSQFHHQAVEPPIGHQQIGAPPDDQDGHVHTGQGPGHLEEGFLPLRLDVEGSRTTHPVGGERAEGMVLVGRPAEPSPQGGEIGGKDAHRPTHQLGSAISSSGREVRSPAPSVQHRSPGWRMAATAWHRSDRPAT